MARKTPHEDHINHEAWAIPYGDLITLLLAFFVVMYAISSINQGKYRVLSEALHAAFSGAPRSVRPIQIGPHNLSGTRGQNTVQVLETHNLDTSIGGIARDLRNPSRLPRLRLPVSPAGVALARAQASLGHLDDAVAKALAPLVRKQLVRVRRSQLWLEIEIGSDVLFDSGSAQMPASAEQILQQLAKLLQDLPNSLRVEGYTDDTPIHTAQFPSNWELSAARAASVVHLMIDSGISADRISLAGYGEYRPEADNSTAAGRNRNRRVVIVVLADNAALRAWLGDPGRLPADLLPARP